MSQRATGSTTDRLRRIHALERVADEQREQLRLQAHGLAAAVQESELVKKISASVQQGRALAEGLSSGKSIWSSLLSHRSGNGDSSHRFPWGSALSTAGGLCKIASWWRQRER